MAQIIKHRRGSLESISGATKRAGELLVVTGSSGITAANGDSILFVGIDGSTATPSNKVLQGTTVPDLTGASYDTSVDGIPFYDSSAEKLYILNKGGNVEVKATANTGGTGIVSGSSQVTPLLPSGTVSGSSQVIGILGELNSFTQSVDSKFSDLSTYTQSVDSDLTELFATASDHESRVDALEAFSSSLGDGFITEAELAAATGALEQADDAIEGRLNNIEGFTSSIDTTIKTKLNAEGVISGSSQVNADSITNFDTNVKDKLNADSVISGSSQVNANDITNFDTNVKDKLNADGVISGSSQVTISSTTGFSDFSSSLKSTDDAQQARLSSLESFSSSAEGDLSELFSTASNHETRIDDLESFSSSIDTAITVSGSDVTINGNFTVSGTQTIVDSTTVQIGDNIIELNGSQAANGGLYVADATSPNLATGSLLWDSTNDYWVAGTKDNESKVLVAGGDGVISGSSQVDANSITNFDENVKDKLDSDGVISGSSQVQIDSVTGFSTFSSSVDSRVDALEEAVGAGSNIDGRLTALESFSGSQESKDATLETYTASVDSDLTELFATASDHESRVDALEAFSSSLDAGFITEAELAAATGALESADSAQQARLTLLEGFSGSQETKNSTLATYTGSVDSRLNQLSTDSGSQAGRLSSIEGFTSSIDTTIKTKLNAEAVVSSSAQVVAHLIDQATDFGTGRVSADNFGDAAGTSTFTGSFVGDGSGLTGLVSSLKLSGSTGNDSVDLLTDSLLVTGSTGISVAVTDNTITISGVNASTSDKGVASFDADDFSVTSGNVSIKSNGVRAANLNADVVGTGLSLDGVDNSIEVDYGSSAGTAVEGDTSLTIQGTANEIEISGGSITLGAGGTVTVGLPDEVTIQTGSIVGDLSVGADLTVVGNLFVQGTTTTVDSTTIQLGDNIIELNGSGASNAGLLVKDATAPNTVSGSLLWDSTNDYWKGGAEGSEKQFTRQDGSLTSNTVLKSDANGLLVDTTITDDGTDVSITGDFTIGGLTANSFVVSDGSKTLVSVVPSNAGDLIQWNGSSFIASNTVDGGTF